MRNFRYNAATIFVAYASNLILLYIGICGLQWAGHAASMGEAMNVYRILIRNSHGYENNC
jgi:hypothetical protein